MAYLGAYGQPACNECEARKSALSSELPDFSDGFRVEATLIAGRMPALPAKT